MRHTEANYNSSESLGDGNRSVGEYTKRLSEKLSMSPCLAVFVPMSSFSPMLQFRCLFQPKMVYLLLCYFLVFGGGLIGCSNSAPLGLGGLNVSAGLNVTKIGTIQQNQNATATVYLQGRVINRAPLLSNGAYKLEDATGTIWVLTNQSLPNIGDEVTIEGQLKFQSIPIGGQDLGELYVQEQKQLEHRAGQPKQTPTP